MTHKRRTGKLECLFLGHKPKTYFSSDGVDGNIYYKCIYCKKIIEKDYDLKGNSKWEICE